MDVLFMTFSFIEIMKLRTFLILVL